MQRDKSGSRRAVRAIAGLRIARRNSCSTRELCRSRGDGSTCSVARRRKASWRRPESRPAAAHLFWAPSGFGIPGWQTRTAKKLELAPR